MEIIKKEISFELNKDRSINWKKRTDETELYNKAKKDFEAAIHNSSKKEIEDAIPGYGLSASRFAMKYVNPVKNPILYKKIYNIYYNYFSKLEV